MRNGWIILGEGLLFLLIQLVLVEKQVEHMKYIRLLKMDLRYCKKRILIGLGISVILVLFCAGI